MTAETDELLLIRRAARHDTEAMSQLYRLTADRLFASCRRYVENAADAEDVLQESYLKIFSRLSAFSYRGPGSFLAWASRIVVNESISLLRRQRNFQTLYSDNDVYDAPADEPPEGADDIPPQVLQDMICALPTGYRTVFNLYVFENKSHREIASLLNIAESTSASQLHRAKQMLARQIKAYMKK